MGDPSRTTLPGGQHHLEGQHVVPGHAVLEAAQASGVGGHVPADGRDLVAGRVGRVPQALLGDSPAQVVVDDAGLDHGDLVGRVDRLDGGHQLGGEDDAAVDGVGPARQPGPRSPGDERRAGGGAGRHHLGHLGGGPGPHHGDGLPERRPLRFVVHEAAHDVGIGDDRSRPGGRPSEPLLHSRSITRAPPGLRRAARRAGRGRPRSAASARRGAGRASPPGRADPGAPSSGRPRGPGASKTGCPGRLCSQARATRAWSGVRAVPSARATATASRARSRPSAATAGSASTSSGRPVRAVSGLAITLKSSFSQAAVGKSATASTCRPLPSNSAAAARPASSSGTTSPRPVRRTRTSPGPIRSALG